MAITDTQPQSRNADLTTPQYWNSAWRDERITVRAARSGRIHALVRLVARLLDERGSDGLDVLEIGCAPGTMLAQLATLRPQDRLHGVDFSRPGLVEAERLLAAKGVQATLSYSDFREFAPQRKFDLVYSIGFVEHFTDPTAALAQHVRLCAPGGQVAVSVPNHRGRVQEWFIQQLDPRALESHNLQVMDVESLRQVFVAAGVQGVVAGSSGTSTIRSRDAKGTLRTRFLRRVAQGWNLANRVGPRLSARRSVIWAHGRVGR